MEVSERDGQRVARDQAWVRAIWKAGCDAICENQETGERWYLRNPAESWQQRAEVMSQRSVSSKQ